MQNEDDLRGLAKCIEFLRAISVLFLVLNIYWFNYHYFRQLHLTNEIVDKIFLNLQGTGIFDHVLYTKLCSILFLAIAAFGTRGVKAEKVTWTKINTLLLTGFCLFFFNSWLIRINTIVYIVTLSVGYVCMMVAGAYISRLFRHNLMEDVFNIENESFQQETSLIENEYSINFRSKFYYNKRWNEGSINVVNPFRGSIVAGSPGSGKSYCVVNQYIKQMLAKGYTMFLYDFKYPDLSVIAYNALLKNIDKYKAKPSFFTINFDDPRRSHRCNPLNPKFMVDIVDAYESANIIMLNLNRTWAEKQGDFFTESPIVLLASVIWFLRIYKNGKYCTLPHAIEFINRDYQRILPILISYDQLENYLSAFVDAWKAGAADQIQGQIASAKIPLARISSPALYWIMTGDDFTLDINDPEHPKVVTVGNNPDRQALYGAALALYTSRMLKLVNKKGKLKSGLIFDELPTLFVKFLDQVLATARSNRVAVLLGLQDFSQLDRDYSPKESKVIQNMVGNIFVGQVLGETAKILSERFGKILQQRQSVTINRNDKSSSINTQLDMMIPAAKISNLTQGYFVGSVADNFSEKIEQKVFHAEIIVDNEAVKQEESGYKPIPVIIDFTDSQGNDHMEETVQANFKKVKMEVKEIIESELERISKDPELCKLLPEKE